MLELGQPPTRPGWAVDLTRLDQVIDYPARDMTITVQAGLSVARLQNLLAAENQRLPIDVPRADRATLGGILAANVSGPRRLGCGTLRDYLLGFSAINDQGHEIKAGGRVVKNVAGYDLAKLFIGSLGTLGILTQVTLKLRPRPEEQALVTLAAPVERLAEIIEQMPGSRTRPICLELLNPPAAAPIAPPELLSPNDWLLIVGYEGNGDAVAWQVQQLIREMPAGSKLDARIGATALPLWQPLVEFAGLAGSPDADGFSFKANMLASATTAFCRAVDSLPVRPLLQAHAGNGIVIGHLSAPRGQAVNLITALRERVRPGQGRVVILRCPPSWKTTLSVWDTPSGDAGLMRKVKKTLDPGNLFNPGRLL
jgi:glycolate oxidase FAD binding subunit